MRPLFRWHVGQALVLLALCAPQERADLACGGCRSFLRMATSAKPSAEEPQFLERCPICLAVELDRRREEFVRCYGPDRRIWPEGAAIAYACFVLAAETIRGLDSPSPKALDRAVRVLDRAGYHPAAELLRQLIPPAASLAA